MMESRIVEKFQEASVRIEKLESSIDREIP